MGIRIGRLETRNRVFLAPMSGVTDEPFRTAAHEAGAGLVVSEMVASEELVRERRDMVRRARGAKKVFPFVIQLAGREAHWMAEGAKVAQDLGADIIDINMGCPAREVTGGLSGSALMRNLEHAVSLLEATVSAASVPVTLKMRLGWDDKMRNAPELARRAEASGIAMVTVHGRTRCQFYTGRADWQAIALVRDAIKIPLVANGDCQSATDAKAMMAASGADAVMIGRGAYGRPWWPGLIAEGLEQGSGAKLPTLANELLILLRQQEDSITLYGAVLANKMFRKHLGWTLQRLHERALIDAAKLSLLRASLLTSKDNADVVRQLRQTYGAFEQVLEAA
jgi:tRNA-dihydrouridine synthase B